MGLTQSHSYEGGAALSPVASRLSYFLPAPSQVLTHDHSQSASDAASVEAVLTARLPPDIVHRILDLAHVWTMCRITNRHRFTVQAGGAEPHGRRGDDWAVGQERELAADVRGGIASAPGLRDRPGNVWYLASAPVGCTSDTRAVPLQEDWDALDGPTVVDARMADWLEERRQERLDFTPGEEEEDEMGLAPDDGAARQQWWLRSIVLETYSRDQGWTVNDDHYGTYSWSFSWFELSLLRGGRQVPGSRHLVQFNVVAGQYFKVHRVELDHTHPLVRAARDGDRIVLWVRAMEPGWQNVVRRAALTVYAAPFPPQL